MSGSGVDGGARWRPPVLWRAALRISPYVVGVFCRLRVTGDVPEDRREGPLILAANHIGSFDPFVLTAACARRHVAPRILATGGLFRAPVVGALMRTAGHLRVDRRHPTVADALPAAHSAIEAGSVVLAYPEGRITLDPGLWPERGKTGLARLAIATGTPVVPVAQWGAHLILPWGSPHGMIGRLVWSVVHRPVVRVHFGAPVSLDDLGPTVSPDRSAARVAARYAAIRAGNPAASTDPRTATESAGIAHRADVAEPADVPELADSGAIETAGAAPPTGPIPDGAGGTMVRARAVHAATDRIIDAIIDGLVPLRAAEPRLPKWVDPQRPLSSSRTHRYRGSTRWPLGRPPEYGGPAESQR